MSVGPGGQQADSASGTSNPGRTCCEIMGAAISGNGQFVAFQSSANNLVRRDANGNEVDVFVRDRKLGVTELVSLGTGGPQGDTFSGYPAISRDGRFVAFYSEADNLVPNDTNRIRDIFVRDRKLGTTEIASLAPGGALAEGFFGSDEPAISPDGRYVAFWSDATNLVANDTNGLTDVFVHDRVTGKNDRVSVGPGGVQANDDSYSGGPPALSTDGRFAAFASAASNLVEGDTNGVYDVFVRDRKRGRTERVSVGQRGVQGDGSSFYPAISADGRYVAFVSLAANLVPGDTNGSLDVFVRDRLTGTTERVSVPAGWRAGARAERPFRGVDLRPRPLRRVRVPGRESRSRRQQRPRRRVRPRPPARHDRTGQRRAGRDRARRAERLRAGAGDLGGRALRRLPVLRDQPRRARHQRPGGHLRPRPLSGPEGRDGRKGWGGRRCGAGSGERSRWRRRPWPPCRPGPARRRA